MAPIDFEKELQERLRSQEAKPSPEAWDRIAARLEEEGPVPSGKPWGWIGLAAASVFILLGFLFLWDPAGESPAIHSVVESPEIQLPEKTPAQSEEEWIPDPSTSREVQIVAGEKDEPDTGGESKKVTGEVTEYQKRKEVAVNGEPMDTEVKVDEILPDTGSVNKAETAVAFEGTAPEFPEEGGKEDEIEALLQQAQEAIALQKDKDTLSAVDAMTLLDRAEDELDQTFREKIISKLRSGVGKFRTAVADRNK